LHGHAAREPAGGGNQHSATVVAKRDWSHKERKDRKENQFPVYAFCAIYAAD